MSGVPSALPSGQPTERQGVSWPRALAALLKPGPPPRTLVRSAAVLSPAAAALCIALAAVGLVTRGDANHYFGEKQVAVVTSAGILFACAAVCFRNGRGAAAPRLATFWKWSAVLFAFLGLDDLFRIHERIDELAHHLAGLDAEDPVTDHLDDLIVAAYALPALALWFRHRKELVRLKWMVLTLGLAFAGFCAMVLCDLAGVSTAIEDSLKTLSGTLILLAFLAGGQQAEAAVESASPR